MKSIATWRCKCGARVKVETDLVEGALRATVAAHCPRCGDERLIYGRNITSVGEENDTGEERRPGRMTRFQL